MAIDSFPLHSGNRWVYQTYNSFDTLTALNDTIINGVVCHPLISANFTGYYTNKFDGLYEQAYRGSSDDLTPSLFGLGFRGDADTLIIPDTALHITKYSYNSDSTWNSFSNILPFYLVTKKFMGYVTISTSMGKINCMKQYVYVQGMPEFAYQYFSPKGLIRQIIVTYYSTPGEGNTYSSSTTTLVSTNF